jgi:early secretory antigenic target protein ESAT-6
MVIKVDHARMEHAHTQMQKISKELDQKLDTLRSMLQKIHWIGNDSESYKQHQAQWDQAVRDINKILNEIGGAVGIARENYVTTEMNNAKVWS